MPTANPTVRVPPHFFRVRYNGARHPLAGSGSSFREGANCQRFVFALLKHFGYEVGPMRSSELWTDRRFTRTVQRMRPMDILMFNRDRSAGGAHLALYLGDGCAIHLAKEIGRPVIWQMSEFLERARYRTLIGIKRPIRPLLRA
jgi:cell wall-associated NlpC family hydrolase